MGALSWLSDPLHALGCLFIAANLAMIVQMASYASVPLPAAEVAAVFQGLVTDGTRRGVAIV